jgi:hypothetical protein
MGPLIRDREEAKQPMAGVLDEPYSQLTLLSGVAGKAASLQRLEPCPSYVAWRVGMATPLSELS